jgi:UDP-N-acetylglucosamine--N-acetylmuramyl-(pentapeptide) pyrophosphoryl-undecaprenol N-acetylglucosamine transferase
MNASAERPVLIMAGGTGGHVFPGLAVATELRARGVPVRWLGARGGMEATLVPNHQIEFEGIETQGLRGKGLGGWLRAPFRLLRAVRQARAVLRRLQPRCVVSFGGFAAGPGGLAAAMSRIPLIVHEQNAIAGLTNRVLARFATRRFVGFADALKKAVWTGNPVRANISELADPATRMANRDAGVRLLVLGGSQGARAINRVLPELVSALRQRGLRLQVRHQCGPKMYEETRIAYAQLGEPVQLEPFINDMASAYGEADLVLCRAGALTLAELCAAGVGSVLVPFPHAVDDHQTRNARALVDIGAALLVPESSLEVAALATQLAELCADRGQLLRMATQARTLARADAAAVVAQACIEVAQ